MGIWNPDAILDALILVQGSLEIALVDPWIKHGIQSTTKWGQMLDSGYKWRQRSAEMKSISFLGYADLMLNRYGFYVSAVWIVYWILFFKINTYFEHFLLPFYRLQSTQSYFGNDCFWKATKFQKYLVFSKQIGCSTTFLIDIAPNKCDLTIN